ncbi:MAG: DKNYY domain-containing protein [Cellvibrionaceae bacterium]|nr:DKNYY domain-containing protein [Cellvibrionaceae bacterium]
MNIITSGLLIFWGITAMFSAMIFGAPGAINELKTYRMVLPVLYFPCYLFSAYWLLGWTYFDFSAARCLLLSFIIISLLCSPYIVNIINLLRGVMPEGYSVAAKRVYYDGKPLDAHADSFRVLPKDYSGYSAHSNYAADKNRIYLDGRVLADATPDSFKLVNERLGLWADHQYVFCFGCKITNVAPNRITIVDNHSSYWHDQQRLFYRETLLEVAGVKLSTELVGLYLVTDNNVYYDGEHIANADPKSLRAHDDSPEFALDKNRVYYRGESIAADTQSFQLITAPYSKDAQQIFYKQHPIDLPDELEVCSFAFFENPGQYHIAYDNRMIYLVYKDKLKVIAAKHAEQMKYLGEGYAMLNDSIYYLDTRELLNAFEVKNTHIESFKVMDDQERVNHSGKFDARDGHHLFKQGKRVEH